MHCEKCNVDFPEGLRYCKWCGESLVEPPRVTSELHTCPTCAAAIQPAWAYCKSCGERLHSAPREPVSAVCTRCGAVTSPGALNCLRCGEDLTDGAAAKSARESADTSVIAMCSSCGERLDTGSLYCKGCGSAVYSQQVPFGGSALLCALCNSYSPVGSRSCRVCGAPLGQVQQTVVDRPIVPPAGQKKPTLPDLDDHLPEAQSPAEQEQQEITSGAQTAVFPGAGQDDDNRTSRNRAVETNLLPGTAGSRSEQQAPTSIMQMGRTTGPVEDDQSEIPVGETASGALGGSREVVDRPNESDATVEFPAFPAQKPTGGGPTTLGLGANSPSSPLGAENKTEVFASRPQEGESSPRSRTSEDEVRTREFTPPPRPPDLEQTRQIPVVEPAAESIQPTREISSWTQGAGVQGVEPVATREYAQVETVASAPEGASQPLPKKRTGSVVASLVVAAIVIGAAIFVAWWFIFARAKPVTRPITTEQPAPAPPVTAPPEKPPAPPIPEGMVMVAAGTFSIGRDDGDPIEQPQHKVDVPAFFIDRTEVTNAAYKKFVDATDHKPPSNWNGANYPAGRGEAPVTSVTWQDAADYARWAQKRLPSESEWEAAARGLEGRIYPWGNDWRSGAANIGVKPDKPTAEQYPTGLKNVSGYPQGASPFGAVDMIGNAWEWVADEIKLYPGNTVSSLDVEAGVTYRVIRGGAYDGNKVHDATYRGYLDGSVAYPKVGFRCAKDAK